MPVWLRGFANLLDQAGISFRRNGFARISRRQHPGVIRSAAVAYAGFFCYMINGLQNQIPKPYSIAFISLTIRVRISCSILLQSKRRR